MTQIAELIEGAKIVSEKSYSPYSNFKVGAALETVDGRIFLGTNIENASFSATICAERVALFKAVSEGETEFNALAIYNEKYLAMPCGMCLQALCEFCDDLTVIVADNNDYKVFNLKDLMPMCFKYEC